LDRRHALLPHVFIPRRLLFLGWLQVLGLPADKFSIVIDLSDLVYCRLPKVDPFDFSIVARRNLRFRGSQSELYRFLGPVATVGRGAEHLGVDPHVHRRWLLLFNYLTILYFDVVLLDDSRCLIEVLVKFEGRLSLRPLGGLHILPKEGIVRALFLMEKRLVQLVRVLHARAVHARRPLEESDVRVLLKVEYLIRVPDMVFRRSFLKATRTALE